MWGFRSNVARIILFLDILASKDDVATITFNHYGRAYNLIHDQPATVGHIPSQLGFAANWNMSS